jgi:hypothetical protein
VSTTTDQRAALPASVTVLFPRQDSGVPAADPTPYVVTLASLSLAEAGSPVATHDGSQPVWSSCVAYWTGGGSAANDAELQALANQMATDWYRWRLAPCDLVLQGMAPWTPEGGHDLCFDHAGVTHCETRVTRGPWLEHADTPRMASGTYGSSTPGNTIIGGSTTIVGGTVNVVDATTNFTGGATVFGGPTYYQPSGSTSISSNTNNFTLPTRPVSVLNVTTSSKFTGIVAPAIVGFRLVLINKGTAILYLTDEDTSSTAANRLRTPYRQTIPLPPNHAVELQYDGDIARWRVLWVSDMQAKGRATQTVGADKDDWVIDLAKPYQVWTVTGADRALTGIDSVSGVIDGYVLYAAVEAGSYTLTLKDNNAGSSAINRIRTPGARDFVVRAGGGVLLVYDGGAGNWRVIATRDFPVVCLVPDAPTTIPTPDGPWLFAQINAAFTAARALTLPAANAVLAGTRVQVSDPKGYLSGTNYANMTPYSGDKINGSTGTYSVNVQYADQTFTSDGSAEWTTYVPPSTTPSGVTVRTEGSLAAAGTNQGNAAAIVTDAVTVSGADGTKGVILPNTAGAVVTLTNAATPNTLKIYPHSGAQIAGLGANNPLNTGTPTFTFFRVSSTQWNYVTLT